MFTRLNPVSLPRGTHQTTEDEFVLESFPVFAISRIFDTAQARASPLGSKHRTNLDRYIQDGAEGGYEYVALDGIPVAFNKPDPHPGVRETNTGHKHLSLEPLPRSGLRLHDSRATTETTFRLYPGRIWYPVTYRDASGLVTRIERTRAGLIERIVHPTGVTLSFQNDAKGQRLGYDVVGLDGTTLAVMRYSYDAEGRLTSAVTPFGKSWGWQYGDGWVTSHDGGETRTTHRFDDRGRVIAVDTGGGYNHGQIAYHDDRNQVTVTHGEPDNEVFEKFWFDSDERGFMSANPLGEISYRQFDPDHQLTAEIDANGHRTAYRYDSYGNTSSVIDPEGRETFTAYDDMGNVLVRKDAGGNAWRYRYDDDDLLVEVTDPMGHRTNLINNELGQPTQIMRHDGLIEFRAYDEHHRLVSLIDFNSAETQFTYDAFHRLTAIKDPAGEVTRLIYDEIEGRPFSVPSRILRPDGIEIRRSFRADGNVKSVTDGEGRTTQYAYGAYDVLEAITDPKGNTLRFEYDSQKRLTRVTNQLGLTWTFERDVAGRLLRETDFDGRTLSFTYDPGGWVIRRDNPDGGHLEHDYDKSGLMVELRAFAPGETEPEVTTYAYDETGSLIEAVNAEATIALERNALGRVVAETTNGVRIESEIDCCGRRTKRTLDDQVVDFAYDGTGGLRAWRVAGHETVMFERNAMGLETRRHAANGFDLQQGWDAVGQMTWQAGNGLGRSYSWSNGFDPVAINDAIWGEKHYQYDTNGQITQTRHGDTDVERFGYNADLNLAASGDAERFQNWETSAAGVVKLARGPKGEIVKLVHDDNGRVIKRTVERAGFRPKTWTFSWNALDQMVEAHCPDGRTWTYAYDAFGRRIAKRCRDHDTRFVWDGDVVAREIRDGHTIDWYFEPGSFRPMARIEGRALAHIVTDHLGTPKEMVSERGSLLWAADHDTWGSVRRAWTPRQGDAPKPIDATDPWSVGAVAGALASTAEEDALLCPIRFQGQWQDAETGLCYNRFRYYDASNGAYQSKDPVRLAGGMRVHGYVRATTNGIDPTGLNNLFRPVRNGSGGTTWVSNDAVCQNDFSDIVENATGPITILTGTHGQKSGVFVPELRDRQFFDEDLQRWGNNPNVTVLDVFEISDDRLNAELNGPNTVAAWCYSGRDERVVRALGCCQ